MLSCLCVFMPFKKIHKPKHRRVCFCGLENNNYKKKSLVLIPKTAD